LSADGSYLAFATDPGTFGTQSSVYLFDRAAGTTTLVSHSASSPTVGASGRSDTPSISADGSFVAFESSSTALVAGVSYGQSGENVFLYDRLAGTNSLVSHAAGSPATATGGLAPTISAAGSSVAFLSSAAAAALNVYLFDRVAGTAVLVSHVAGQPAVPGNGDCSSLLVSADGSAVAYQTLASNLTGAIEPPNSFNALFLWNRASGANTLVSHDSGSNTTPDSAGAFLPALSADGSRVVFVSGGDPLSPPLPPPGIHLFLYTPATGATTFVTNDVDSLVGPALAGDGSSVAFTTALVPGVLDANEALDVGLYNLATASFQWVSLRDPGLPAVTGHGSGSFVASVAADASLEHRDRPGGGSVRRQPRGGRPLPRLPACRPHDPGQPTGRHRRDHRQRRSLRRPAERRRSLSRLRHRFRRPGVRNGRALL
jgi:Tol biopolymer transport system component